MPDADDAACLFAFRRWRDESGAALTAAARSGIAATVPACATLVLASEHDTDVPRAASSAVARWCAAELRVVRGASHLGPLLGRAANACAASALNWCETTLRLARKYTIAFV